MIYFYTVYTPNKLLGISIGSKLFVQYKLFYGAAKWFTSWGLYTHAAQTGYIGKLHFFDRILVRESIRTCKADGYPKMYGHIIADQE